MALDASSVGSVCVSLSKAITDERHTMSPEQTIPCTNDALADLHCNIAMEFAIRLGRFATSLSVLCGEPATKSAFASLLIPENLTSEVKARLLEVVKQKSLPEFISDEAAGGCIDSIELTSICRQAAEYANQGCAPLERPDCKPSLEERERRVRDLQDKVARFRPCSSALIGPDCDYIWEAFDTRKAIDGFGGKASLKGLRVLAGLPLAVLRTAVSTGELRPDKDGLINPEAALSWLLRRREFCPSRWRNLKDDQWPFDPARIVADDADTVLVPQDAEGKPFVPDLVVRSARGGGLSITIGKKSQETQLSDYFDALKELSGLAKHGDIPRWRRRNAAGNWGIVRARGPWVAVSKSEIARQLAAVSPSGAAA